VPSSLHPQRKRMDGSSVSETAVPAIPRGPLVASGQETSFGWMISIATTKPGLRSLGALSMRSATGNERMRRASLSWVPRAENISRTHLRRAFYYWLHLAD